MSLNAKAGAGKIFGFPKTLAKVELKTLFITGLGAVRLYGPWQFSFSRR